MAAKEKTVKEELYEYHDIMKKVRLLQFELGQIPPNEENVPHTEPDASTNTVVVMKKDAIVGADVRKRLQTQLNELLAKTNRLEYYVGLLDKDTATLIRAKYWERYSWPDMVERFGHPRSTLYGYITDGLEKLNQMFEYAEDFLIDET